MRFLNKTNQPSKTKSEISTVLENSSLVQKLLDTDKDVKSKYFLVVPSFLSMLISANKDYLLSYNVHYEIARHLHLERPISKDQMIPTLKAVFIYNLDKERLEAELRKFLLTRLLDRYSKPFDFDYEQQLSNAIHDYYGANYNHRLNLILSNIKEESNITHNDKCIVSVTPNATWPI